ncbi:hypothetical protein GA0061096_4391 [Fictibacillus enclensis]|nr:hypothetical protein GA0061096_4391 [Fictibacillus enclensis]
MEVFIYCGQEFSWQRDSLYCPKCGQAVVEGAYTNDGYYNYDEVLLEYEDYHGYLKEAKSTYPLSPFILYNIQRCFSCWFWKYLVKSVQIFYGQLNRSSLSIG